MLGMTGSNMGVRAMMGGDMEDHTQGLRFVPISVDDIRHFVGHGG